MKSVAAILLLAASALAQKGSAAKPTTGQLVGTWRLVSIEDTMKEGVVKSPEQFGPHPLAHFIHEGAGSGFWIDEIAWKRMIAG